MLAKTASSIETSRCGGLSSSACHVTPKTSSSCHGSPCMSGGTRHHFSSTGGGGGGGGATTVWSAPSGLAGNGTDRTVKSVPQCTSALLVAWRRVCRLWQPTLRTVGQCLFGLAMLFIIAGIALCIWGYLGTAIRPFQIFGPVCIGVGVAIYVLGCVLCCREYPDYERSLRESERQEKVRRAIRTMSDKEAIEWIQQEPEVYEDFRQLAMQILNNHGLFSNSGNVIANLYVNQLCPEV